MPSNAHLIQRIRAALLGSLCCIVLLAVVDGLRAQQPSININQQARELAQKLGRERSAEGLETIIATRNDELLRAYVDEFRKTSMRRFTDNKRKAEPLPADIEALIVKHYSDPKVGGALRTLLTHNGTKYQTRRLFDLMYAEWRTGKVRASTYPIIDSILSTDLVGIEAPLLEQLQTLRQPASSDAQRLVAFLGVRKYRPAIPVLAARVRGAAPGNPPTSVLHALLTIEAGEAVSVTFQRLAWLRAQSQGPEVAREADALILWIAQLPADTPVDFSAFKQAVSATPSDSAKGSLLRFIGVRREQGGVADVLRMLGETQFYRRALAILIAFDSPDVWKQARDEVEQLKQQGVLNDGQYQFARMRLDEMIANPDKHFAEKKRQEREREFDAKKLAQNAKKTKVQELKDGPAEKYIAAHVEFLNSQERLAQEYSDLRHAVGLRSEIGNEYLILGNLFRFPLKQPDKAIELYTKAEQLGGGIASFFIADAYEFDLRDTPKALEVYQRMLQQMRKAPAYYSDAEASFAKWGQAWLTHQIEYLRTGRRFRGRVGYDDIEGAALLLYAPMQGDPFDLAPLDREVTDAQRTATIDRNAVAKKLDSLPPSGLTLLRTISFATLLPDADAILRYLARHDPAGYASACFFGMVDMFDRPAGANRFPAQMFPGLGLPPTGAANPLRRAVARFDKERNIDLDTRPDPRMESPEKTWQLFIDSLKRGDIATAMACLTPGMQAKSRPLFTQMPADNLRALANGFSGFSRSARLGGGIEEATVFFDKQASTVIFVKSGGEWKINAM